MISGIKVKIPNDFRHKNLYDSEIAHKNRLR
jgi:hypothetical protein